MNLEEFKQRYTERMEAQGCTFSGNLMKIPQGERRWSFEYIDWQKKYNEVLQAVNTASSDEFSPPTVVVKGGVNTFANGSWRYHTYGRGDGPQSCITDYACDTGRRFWKDYVVERDASGKILREGPAPFKTDDDRIAYERLTGLTAMGAAEGDKEHPYAEYFKQWPSLKEAFPEFANWGKGIKTAEGKCNVESAFLPQAVG